MLDVIGTVVLVAVIALCLYAFVSAIPISRTGRLAIVTGAGAWTGLAAAFAEAGQFANTSTPPLIGLFVALPPLVTAVAAIGFPAVRAALLAIPLPTLIGVNITRVVGVLFVLLAAVDRLGGPFPQSAGWGDVITGVLAIPLMWLAARAPDSNGKIAAWNAFGTLDLVAAVTLGVISANGSPLQLITAGAGSAAVQDLPWALIPAVLVPFFLITHGIVFAQLRARRSEACATA